MHRRAHIALLFAWLAGSGCELALDFDRGRIESAPDAAMQDGGIGGASAPPESNPDGGPDAGVDSGDLPPSAP